MVSVEVQNNGLTTWVSTWFYYLVFKFASWFHISDVHVDFCRVIVSAKHLASC